MTGVQTCALPIFGPHRDLGRLLGVDDRGLTRHGDGELAENRSHGHDDVMDGANFFTQRVKNACAGKLGDEDAATSGRHGGWSSSIHTISLG